MSKQIDNIQNDGIEKLLSDLEEYRQWAEANIYEVPLALPDTLWQASEVIKALLPLTSSEYKLNITVPKYTEKNPYAGR